MTAEASVSIRASVAGVTITERIVKTEEVESLVSIELPAGVEGTMGPTAGTQITLPSTDGWSNSDFMLIVWTNPNGTRGSRYGVDVLSIVDGTKINIQGGTGDTLPAVDTALVIGKQVDSLVDIDGDKVVVMTMTSRRDVSVEFKTSAPALIAHRELLDGVGLGYVSDTSLDTDVFGGNFLAGGVVAKISAASGTTESTVLNIGVLLNAGG